MKVSSKNQNKIQFHREIMKIYEIHVKIMKNCEKYNVHLCARFSDDARVGGRGVVFRVALRRHLPRVGAGSA